MTGVPIKTHIASDSTMFMYPAAGDAPPPGGSKVLLLTIGGICVSGQWKDDGSFLAWAPLPKRDKTKEAMLCQRS